ncbi:MAG: peptidoglycan editing factor PgeF [Candidatus Rifleibacteriota bacterium]
MIKVSASKNLICFSEATDGDLSFYLNDNEQAYRNWFALKRVKELRLGRPAFAWQEHKDNIIQVDSASNLANVKKADALITSTKDLPVGVFSADCTPLLFWSDKAVAAVHSGWKSCLLDIGGKTVKKLQSLFKLEGIDVKAAIGPCIGSCCLEMGDEVYDEFAAADKSYKDFFIRRHKWFLDLAGLNRFQLMRAGLPGENIQMFNKCTYCDSERFFSYRRQKRRNGSMFSFAVKLK